jgi:hypothetical protein
MQMARRKEMQAEASARTFLTPHLTGGSGSRDQRARGDAVLRHQRGAICTRDALFMGDSAPLIRPGGNYHRSWLGPRRAGFDLVPFSFPGIVPGEAVTTTSSRCASSPRPHSTWHHPCHGFELCYAMFGPEVRPWWASSHGT